MLIHGAGGFVVGAIFVAALLASGIGPAGVLWRVGGMPAVALLWLFSSLTFGSALIGSAVMMAGHAPARPHDGARTSSPVPSCVRSAPQ